MRKTILTFIAAFLAISIQAATPAKKLQKRLQKLQKTGIMVGHQDDPVYGSSWAWDRGRSDVKDVCGDYPAIMGWELGSLELGRAENLDKVPFDRMREEIVAQDARGGISTLSWHPWNPVTGENAWDPTGNAVAAVLPGGAQHEKFNVWLQRVATFLGSLKDAKGNAIAVVWRPWHEMSGSWFWWGDKRCTPEEYKQLYRYTYEVFTKKYGLTNLLWAYSPGGGAEDYMAYYPGDDIVSLFGVDTYDFSADDKQYKQNVKRDLDTLVKYGTEHKKLIAFTETGQQQLPTANWFTQVLWPSVKDYPISYVLFWRNAHDQAKETYMASPGHRTASDFKSFYEEPKTLFAKDIKATR